MSSTLSLASQRAQLRRISFEDFRATLYHSTVTGALPLWQRLSAIESVPWYGEGGYPLLSNAAVPPNEKIVVSCSSFRTTERKPAKQDFGGIHFFVFDNSLEGFKPSWIIQATRTVKQYGYLLEEAETDIRLAKKVQARANSAAYSRSNTRALGHFAYAPPRMVPSPAIDPSLTSPLAGQFFEWNPETRYTCDELWKKLNTSTAWMPGRSYRKLLQSLSQPPA